MVIRCDVDFLDLCTATCFKKKQKQETDKKESYHFEFVIHIFRSLGELNKNKIAKSLPTGASTELFNLL
jgi:hypothetical protein